MIAKYMAKKQVVVVEGGSMHLTDVNNGMYGSIPIVASSIGLSIGSAYHQKLNKIKNITVVFIGDGT